MTPQDPSPSSSAGGDPGILGLDNVRLDLPLAGVGSRVLAMTVDQLLVLILILLVSVGTFGLAAAIDEVGTWLIAALSLAIFAIQWGYFSAFEIALDGQTPGKMVVGLRTVSHLGGRPSATAILARNFLRSIDIMVGLPIMSLDRRSRRLGDLVASTLVVHDHPEPSLRLGAVPPSWSAREISIVESFLRRADSMEDDVALELAAKLTVWLGRHEPAFLGAPTAEDSLTKLRRLLRPEWV